MAITAADTSYYAPEFTVEVNGREIAADVSKRILNLTIEQVVNKTNNFRFEVQDEFRNGRFQWLGHELFKYGNTVKIEMGYVNNMHKLLEGKIQNIAATFSKGTAPTFTVEGSDKAYDFLMEEGEPKIFKKKKDSDIAEIIAKMPKTQLDAVVDDTKHVFPTKTKKGGKSYFTFLKEMAQSNGFEFYLSGRKLYFVKVKKDKDAILTLTWGKELISFNPSLNTDQAISEVVVRSWNRSSKEPIEARANAGEETRQEDRKKTGQQNRPGNLWAGCQGDHRLSRAQRRRS